MADAPLCVAQSVCAVLNEELYDDDAVSLSMQLREKGLLAPICTARPSSRCSDCPCRVPVTGRPTMDADLVAKARAIEGVDEWRPPSHGRSGQCPTCGHDTSPRPVDCRDPWHDTPLASGRSDHV